ncbi:MAG: RNA-directed DNA polymerase [Thermoflexales bacterium]|nr:RNA-directed DNA polymerase [Thermoflexales bacterium]
MNNLSPVLSASAEELRKKFQELQTREDVANLLEIDESRLNYYLYIIPEPHRYTTFQIPKKSGKFRTISVPATALKILQRKLNQVLLAVYQPKAAVHGFVLGKSIVTNAQMHLRQKFVLNIDLKDFFPSINFGRVRGMFVAPPYKLPPMVATILAQICCWNNQLPQGAPTSPIVSNLICAKMDSQLLRLAEKHRCVYTRYADDITFSTSTSQFPIAIARKSEVTNQVEVGGDLGRVINENGFEINSDKIRLQTRQQRQEVTGLIANGKTPNKTPNVQRRYLKQIRAMLHAWEKFGLDNAEKDFLEKHDGHYRHPNLNEPSFKKVVCGKIEFLGMVRGKDDVTYHRFRDKLWSLAPELARFDPEIESTNIPTSVLIITEGQTDWKHLKAALQQLKEAGDFSDLNIEFREYDDSIQMGDGELVKLCIQMAKIPQSKITICLFDSDAPSTLKPLALSDAMYKHMGGNVFAMVLPTPNHRQGLPGVCIEHYYQDSEITREDTHGRRLYLSNEFHEKSMLHRTKHGISTSDRRVHDLKKVVCQVLCKLGGAGQALVSTVMRRNFRLRITA